MRRGAPFRQSTCAFGGGGAQQLFPHRWMKFAAGLGFGFGGTGFVRSFFTRSAAKCEGQAAAPAAAAAANSVVAGCGGEMIIDGVRVGIVKTPTGWLYTWNGFVDPQQQQSDGIKTTSSKKKCCAPQLVIDFSPSMDYGKYSKPTEAAIVDAATVFQKSASSGSATTTDNNGNNKDSTSSSTCEISSPTLTVYSGNASQTELPVNEPTTWRDRIKDARRKLRGSTHPEAAMELLFSEVIPLLPDNAIVPMTFATDGEFNGLDGCIESYSDFWSGVSKKLAKLTEKRGLSFSFRVLGVVDDDLVHIKTMQKALFNPETPFSYFTVKDRSEIGAAFAHTVSLALEAAGPQIRLKEQQQRFVDGDDEERRRGGVGSSSSSFKKIFSQVLYQNDCVTHTKPMHSNKLIVRDSKWNLADAVAAAIFESDQSKNFPTEDKEKQQKALREKIATWSADIADAIVRIRRDNAEMREKLHKGVAADGQLSADKRSELAQLAKDAQAMMDKHLDMTKTMCNNVPGFDVNAKNLAADIADRRDNGQLPPAALLDWLEAAQLDTKFIRETAETSSKAPTAKEAFEGTQAVACTATASMNIRMHQTAMKHKGAGGFSYGERAKAVAACEDEEDKTGFTSKARKVFWRS